MSYRERLHVNHLQDWKYQKNSLLWLSNSVIQFQCHFCCCSLVFVTDSPLEGLLLLASKIPWPCTWWKPCKETVIICPQGGAGGFWLFHYKIYLSPIKALPLIGSQCSITSPPPSCSVGYVTDTPSISSEKLVIPKKRKFSTPPPRQ